MMIVRYGFMIVGDLFGGKIMVFKVSSKCDFRFCSFGYILSLNYFFDFSVSVVMVDNVRGVRGDYI